jgi:hypothetical protein
MVSLFVFDVLSDDKFEVGDEVLDKRLRTWEARRCSLKCKGYAAKED